MHESQERDDRVDLQISADLFSIRNLILSADQAMAHGYRLNDVSLMEERVLAATISHKLKTETAVNLIAFVSDYDDSFQETLNTLEFSYKFMSTFLMDREFKSVHSSESGT